MAYNQLPAQGPAVGASSLPVIPSTETSTGSITTQNLVPAGVATASSAVELALNGTSGISIQISGTYTGALSLQATMDGTNWITTGGLPLLNVNSGVTLASITSALTGIFQANVAGSLKVRITALAAVTGTAVVTLIATPQSGMVSLGAPLPAGGNSIGFVILATNAFAGFSTYFKLISLNTTNGVNVKSSAGAIGMITAYNSNAAVRYLKIYNKASAPTVGTDVPIFVFTISPNSNLSVPIPAIGLRMTTGISIAMTTGQADGDATAVGAGEVVVNINYV